MPFVFMSALTAKRIMFSINLSGKWQENLLSHKSFQSGVMISSTVDSPAVENRLSAINPINYNLFGLTPEL